MSALTHHVAVPHRTLFFSDGHFGHENIINLSNRPFSDPEDMNEQIIERWNAVVSDDDTVFHLGDVAMGRIADSLPLVGRLNGTIHLIAGNHDRCWVGQRKVGDWVQRYLDVGFASIATQATIELREGLTALMCHFPYFGDSGEEDRFVEHRPAQRGQWLLHGHVHNAWKRNGRQINVGADVWNFTPVTLEEILTVIDEAEAAEAA